MQTHDDRSDYGLKRRKLSYGDIDVKNKIDRVEQQLEVSSVASGWDDALIQAHKDEIDDHHFQMPVFTKPLKKSVFGRKYATEIRRMEADDSDASSF